ncbi:MAG: hypothetical protein M3444_08895 [Acidobacteriota bacterium]|nr:hypothetical protein [Acidobacteriota bacterium]
MRKVTIAVLVAIGLAALIAWNTLPGVERTVQAQQGSPEPGSIDDLVQQATANGEVMVNSPILVSHEDVDGFDEAQANYTIVVAQAVSSQSYATSAFDIETAVTFNVTETLATKAPHICVSGKCSVPAGVSAPASNQLLLLKSGGSIVRNGVSVVKEWTDLPDFTPGQSYLLFIDYDPSSGVGVPAIGPVGVFLVSSSSTLSPIMTDPEKETGLQDDIAERFANSLTQLRNTLNPPPPSSCDPLAEQDCYDNAGSWNSSTCQCTLPPDPCLRKPWLCE